MGGAVSSSKEKKGRVFPAESGTVRGLGSGREGGDGKTGAGGRANYKLWKNHLGTFGAGPSVSGPNS